MTLSPLEEHFLSYDSRRDLVIPGTHQQALTFSVAHFLQKGQEAIAKKGSFFVALSGGSTPKALYEQLATPDCRNALDWKCVHLFFSDERCVSPNNPESNFKMALDAGFSKLPIPSENIYRMEGEKDPEEAALSYEAKISSIMSTAPFDYLMLGMGEDGHTASLFPKTHGLQVENKRVIANFIPQKQCWRLTLTYPCINAAEQITIYVLGKAKAAPLAQVFSAPHDSNLYPIQKVGTEKHKALFILDNEAAALILNNR